jgi:hypothetical protein
VYVNDIITGIAQSVWRRATCWAARVQFPAVKDFSLLHSVQPDPGAHPATYQLVPGALSPGVKQPGHESAYSLQSSAEFKKGGAIPSLPNTS